MPPHTGTFVKRHLFSVYGDFDETYRISGDYEWLLRVLKTDVSTKYWDKKICTMTVGGASNASLKARFIGLLEDFRAISRHNVTRRSLLKKKIKATHSYLRVIRK